MQQLNKNYFIKIQTEQAYTLPIINKIVSCDFFKYTNLFGHPAMTSRTSVILTKIDFDTLKLNHVKQFVFFETRKYAEANTGVRKTIIL